MSSLLRLPEQLLPQRLVQVAEQLFLQRLKRQIQSLQLLHCILIVHKEAVVQVKTVAGRVLHQIQQSLVPSRVDRSALQLQLLQNPSHCVSDKLRARGVFIVLRAAHVHHCTSFLLENI